MAYSNQISTIPNVNSPSTDILGRTRVSIPTSLGNYKNTYGVTTSTQSFGLNGTGTVTATNSQTILNVTAGQYLIAQSKEYHYYVAGSPQRIDFTFNNFQLEVGLIKRWGYFSSNAVAPFDSNYDGIYLESNGDTSVISFNIYRNGTQVYSIPLSSWDGYVQYDLSTYDWSKFNICTIDFLWQGGKSIRLCLQLSDGRYVEVHRINYAQNNIIPFCITPNQPLRFEIRSTTGIGYFTGICGAVSRDDGAGGLEVRERNTPLTATPFSIGAIGTRYVLGSLRKLASRRDAFAQITGASVALTSNDSLFVEFVKNPTLLAGTLTYNAITESSLEYAQGGGTQTISAGSGISLGGAFVSSTTPLNLASNNLLATLYGTLDNTMDTIMLIGTPITATMTLTNVINFKELI